MTGKNKFREINRKCPIRERRRRNGNKFVIL